MKNIIKENKQFLFAFFGTLLLILSGSIFVSNSNVQVDELVIKSITPIYEEDSGVKVSEEDGIIFNDKNQEVKYKILVENVLDYDVKFNHVELSNPSEDFLEYEVVGIDTNDVIKTGETKEIEVVLNTVSKEGWGRNFNDELYARVVFDKINQVIDEGTGSVVPENKPVNNNSGVVNNISNNNNVPSIDNVTQDNNVTNKEEVVESSKTEVEEEIEKDDVTHEMMAPSDVSTNEGSIKFYVFILGVSCGVAGVGFILLSKSKLSKYIMFVIVLGTPLLIKADTIAHLPITLKVGFKSQNVMMKFVDKSGALLSDLSTLFPTIKNYYIQNEVSEIPNYINKIDLSNEQNERVVLYTIANEEDANYVDAYLQADGIIYPNEDASRYFAEMTNLDKIENLEGFDTSKVINMSNMFYKTGYESTVFTLDLSNFDTSKVTDMNNMFVKVGFNNPNFRLDVSNFDTSNVTNMSNMFYCTGYNSLVFTLDLSNFDTSNVTDMSYMFYGTGYNVPVFTLDVSKFKTGNVITMNNMFFATGFSSTVFTLDVSGFDTSKVTDMGHMFRSTGEYSPIFNLDLSGFDTTNVVNMENMFYSMANASEVLDITLTIKNPNCTSYADMFLDVAIKENVKIIVNFTSETENLVDQMIATKLSISNVLKGKLIVEADKLDVGDEVYIEDEWFNVISQDDDTITLLTKYNLGTDYRQSTSENYVLFANNTGWEYSTGKNEIDISSWSSVINTYINEYVDYISDELSDDSVTGDLMTLNQLSSLGCVIPTNYEYVEDSNGRTCSGSNHIGWINNNQRWWTKSAVFEYSEYVWIVGIDNHLGVGLYNYTRGIRPVIRVSKETLKKYYDNKNVR